MNEDKQQSMTREYLSDEAFHRRYLKEHPDRETSPWVIGLAAAGIVGGGLVAYKKGLLKPVAEKVIEKLGNYRNTEMGSVIKGFRNWTERENNGGTWRYKMEMLRLDIDHARTAHATRMNQLDNSPFITDRPGELMNLVSQRNNVTQTLNRKWSTMTQTQQQQIIQQHQTKDRWMRTWQSKIDSHIREQNNVTLEQQQQKVKETGYRFATVNDVFQHLDETQQILMREAANDSGDFDSFMSKIYDKQLLIHNENNTFADMRDFQAMTTGIMDSIADDFTAPFVKINPVRMLYLNKFSAANKAPDFKVLSKNTRQPAITHNQDALGEDHVYIAGNVFNIMDPTKAVAENTRLVDGKAGPVARYYRNLAGLTTAQYRRPNNTWGKMKWEMGSLARLGFQDEPIGRDISWNFTRGNQAFEAPNLLDPTTWPSWTAKKIHNVFKPYEGVSRIKLEDAFGADADWVVFNNYKTYEQAGGFANYRKQFTAGRNDLENVTTATLFPYGFFERLNSTLNQIGLGLPNESLGSAFDVAKNLMLYRIAPAYLAVEAWKYMNTESENFLGFQFEDKIGDFYKGASVDAAKMKDSLGITDWAKHMAYLLPGGEQISELPFVGHFLDLNDSEEETRDYWENGEDAVRKGRYWEFGNTPFTGGKIEYYQPNWIRRVQSDYEFSDTMYGSRDEYFENHFIPTIRHPLAPLNHFLIDPYHWEEKHYRDRPYMVTGGSPLLEEFPLIGPALNATVGQVFKPERQMHMEYWNRDKEENAITAENVDGVLQGPKVEQVEDDVPVDPIQIMSDVAAGNGIPTRTREIMVRDDMYPELLAGQAPVAGYEVGENVEGDVATDYQPAASYSPETGPNTDIPMQPITGTDGAPVRSNMKMVNTEDTVYAGYITPSGDITPVEIQQTQFDTINSINKRVKEKALQKAAGDAEANDIRLRDGHPMDFGSEKVLSPMAAENMVSNLYYNLTEMGGAYGFYAETLTGPMDGTNKMATSSDMTSISRNFWDMNIGNLGGDANEIFRRFLPRDTEMGKGYNPIDNTMPSWMPGEGYFTDYQHGDPYTKIKKGEIRLPGEAYERIHGIDSAKVDEAMELNVGASLIGYDVEKIRDSMLRRDEIEDDEAKFVTETGTNWHVKWEEKMMTSGIGLDKEQYMKNEDMGVSGFYDVKADHAKFLEYAAENAEVFKYYKSDNGMGAEKYGGFYDSPADVKKMQTENPEQFKQFIKDSLEGAPMALLDPKTMSDFKYSEEEMFFHNVQQVNFYLHETGQKRGYLIHVNRDKITPDGQESGIQVHGFDYNPELLKYSLSKVEAARQNIHQGLKDGSYGRGDFYDMIDQYRILSDVAPYSEQYRDMKNHIRQWKDLTEEGNKELKEIDEQGGSRKDNVRLYPYRFKHANVEKHKVTVTKVIDNNTFMTEEFDNPIKLAGMRAPAGKNDPNAKKAAAIINLKPGDKVQISIDADPMSQIKKDTYQTIDAVLYNRGININKQLIESGLVKEKIKDFSPAAVHARFSNAEIGFGAMWENFAHIDTPYHTKFLQVRSPLESYKNREIYNKDWQEWSNPVGDFFIPWFQNSIRKAPILAMTAGTLIGASFGNTKFGKLTGALVGLAATTAGIAYRTTYEEIIGKKWVPERRKKEWEMVEYLDTMKYVKYRRLYEYAADKAEKEEGVDVRKMIVDKKGEAEFGDAEKTYLSDLKRKLKSSAGDEYEAALKEAHDYMADNYGPLLEDAEGDVAKSINARLNEIGNDRELIQMGPRTSQALTYYQKSEQTMYGYDPGEPLQNFMTALPKKDREYLTPFIEADEEERDDILRVAPTYMKRVLQASYGEPVDEKEDLYDYFSEHGLPGRGWIGWDDRASLNDIKVKMVNKYKLDPSEFDIWPDAVHQADHANVNAPNLKDKNTETEIREKLYDVLRGIGLEEIMINVSKTDKQESSLNMNVSVDRRSEIIRKMNEDAVNLV